MTETIDPKSEPKSTRATHTIVRHPRALPNGATRRNSQAVCRRDDGNGAGQFVLQGGAALNLKLIEKRDSKGTVTSSDLVDDDGNIHTVLRN